MYINNIHSMIDRYVVMIVIDVPVIDSNWCDIYCEYTHTCKELTLN